MALELRETVRTRRSVRAFQDRPVPEYVIQAGSSSVTPATMSARPATALHGTQTVTSPGLGYVPTSSRVTETSMVGSSSLAFSPDVPRRKTLCKYLQRVSALLVRDRHH